MKKQTLKALEARLKKLNINYNIRKSNYSDCNVLVISNENQPEDVFITDWTYDSELNQKLLGDLIKWLDERDAYFECEYAGTFTVVVGD